MESYQKRLGSKLANLFEGASHFSENPQFLSILNAAANKSDLRHKAAKEPLEFLRSQGIELPEGLSIKVIDKIPPTKPVSDYEFFRIHLLKCHTYWLKKKDGPGYESVQVCWGFEIVPHTIPPLQ
jgi:hypothetical protein